MDVAVALGDDAVTVEAAVAVGGVQPQWPRKLKQRTAAGLWQFKAYHGFRRQSNAA